MGYKKFSGGKFFKFDEEGKQLEGKWGGTKPGKTFKGKETVNGIVSVDGERVVFGLSAALRDMELIPKGTQVRITFTGDAQTKDGTHYKAFDVDVDEDMVINEDMVIKGGPGDEQTPKQDEVPF